MGALWSHQTDQLRGYHRDHLTDDDVALELPTGSGKTMVGLLIAEWRRREYGQRVVYACPTKHLAIQVADAAALQGIKAYALVHGHNDWDPRHVMECNLAARITGDGADTAATCDGPRGFARLVGR
ncbi:Reverse gyrase [Microbacterium oxydans]|uniref:Reverse gyrase n=1 Tax=Microbacterium oxydans TaxID=82380 RepID=A0A3S9WMP2_9MICO|nr:Reverse gyrase [Microbacterium oxydans]